MSMPSPETTPPIYTKTGDDDTTGLLFGERASKASAAIEVCGTLDEAASALGVAPATLLDEAPPGTRVGTPAGTVRRRCTGRR